MATKQKSGKSRKTQQRYLGKPNGVIQPRVEEVGPEHFGIVAIDCAKARAKWMLCNFYGKVLIEPSQVSIGKGPLQLAALQVQQACQEHDIRDQIVAVEMTGTYHRPVQRAFRKAGFETRLVHPFASKHYRSPAHGDLKTDDNDLVAIFRAAVNGFGLLELPVLQTVRIRAKCAKFETRISKSETNSKPKIRKPQTRAPLPPRCAIGFEHLMFGHSCFFRISLFGFRIWLRPKAAPREMSMQNCNFSLGIVAIW